MTTRTCRMCPKTFPATEIGGREKEFCSSKCRAAYHRACRIYTAAMLKAGLVSMETLRRFAGLPSYTLPESDGEADQVAEHPGGPARVLAAEGA